MHPVLSCLEEIDLKKMHKPFTSREINAPKIS